MFMLLGERWRRRHRASATFLLLGAASLASLAPAACRNFSEDDVADRGPASGTAGAGPGACERGGATDSGGNRDDVLAGWEGIAAEANVEAGGRDPEAAGGRDLDAAGGGQESGQSGSHQVSAGAAGRGAQGDEAGAGGQAGAASLDDRLAPPTFEQLVLWLDATTDSCDLVNDSELETWRDQSQYRNTARPVASWLRPTFAKDRSNGHGAVRFTGVIHPPYNDDAMTLAVEDSESLRFGVGDFAYLVVAEWSNDPTPRVDPQRETNRYYGGLGFLLAKQTPAFPYSGVLMAANYPGIFYQVPAATKFVVQLSLASLYVASYDDGLNDAKFRLYEVRRRGTEVALRINAQPQNAMRVKAELDLSAIQGRLLIGGSDAQPLTGEIAEIVALKGTVPDVDLASLERYLMHKYDL